LIVAWGGVMSNTTIDGKELDVKLLEELNETIKKNNGITSKQNKSLLNYTIAIWVATVLMAGIAVVQLFIMIKR